MALGALVSARAGIAQTTPAPPVCVPGTTICASADAQGGVKVDGRASGQVTPAGASGSGNAGASGNANANGNAGGNANENAGGNAKGGADAGASGGAHGGSNGAPHGTPSSPPGNSTGD